MRLGDRNLMLVFMLLAALAVVGRFDYADALEREAEEKVARPLRAQRLPTAATPATLADCRRAGVEGAVWIVNLTADAVPVWSRTCLTRQS